MPISEVKNVIKSAGFNIEGAELKRLISYVDQETKGKVSFEQLVAGLKRKLGERDQKQDLIEAFKKFDKMNTGFVSTVELIGILTPLQSELGISKCEISQLVNGVDFDGDGKIDYHEFVRMLFEIEQLY